MVRWQRAIMDGAVFDFPNRSSCGNTCPISQFICSLDIIFPSSTLTKRYIQNICQLCDLLIKCSLKATTQRKCYKHGWSSLRDLLKCTLSPKVATCPIMAFLLCILCTCAIVFKGSAEVSWDWFLQYVSTGVGGRWTHHLQPWVSSPPHHERINYDLEN